MSITAILVTNIIPLYIIVGLGFIAGKWLDVSLQSLARVAIFIIAPIVVFGAMVKLVFDPAYILLPVIFLGGSAAIVVFVYTLAKKRWKNNTANLIGLGSCAGNTGYFGLPIVLALYGEVWSALYLFMNLSMTVAENSFGFYVAARGHHTVKESLRKLVKLPAVHAIWLGLLVNMSGAHLPDLFFRYWNYAIGAWVYLGMMLMGVALGKCKKFEFDLRLTGWLFFAKFVLWPLMGFAMIALDLHVFHLLSKEVYGMILIFTAAPVMGNLVAYAAQLDLHTEKAATVVLISTIFAIVYIPLLFWFARSIGYV